MLTKRRKATNEIVKDKDVCAIGEAVDLLLMCPKTKFDESVEIAIGLNLDIRKADQNLRGVINLPNGSGKTVRVAVFAKEDKQADAKAAGADIVGEQDLIEKVKGGFLDFDRCVASPDMMPLIGKISRILGPKGLMPNPKLGTVTENLSEAVKGIKQGQVEYRAEKAGIIHACVGKLSFSKEQLVENISAFLEHIKKAKPASVKGVYMRSVAISSTQGPGVKCSA